MTDHTREQGNHAQADPQDVAGVLRELLKERNHRTDGDLVDLAHRCLHLSRGDRDLIDGRARLTQELKERLGQAQPKDVIDGGPELYYIQETRSFVGNSPMWWGANGSGYTTRLDEAGRYTLEDAKKLHKNRDTDLPWPCSEIDGLARPVVDMQHMRPRSDQVKAFSPPNPPAP